MPGPDIWFDAPYDLGVSPRDPDLVYVTDLFRTYRTPTAAATGHRCIRSAVAPGQWTTRGLDVTTTYGVHVDPRDPARVFISYTDIGLFRSEDGGRSWMLSSQGMPQDWRNTTYWVAFDPDRPGIMWGAFSGTHDLPRPKMWRTRDPATYRGGVGVSRDGGRSWSPAKGLPAGAVTHVLVDPRSPVAVAHAVRVPVRARRIQEQRRRGHVEREERGARGAAAVCVAHHASRRAAGCIWWSRDAARMAASATRAMARSTSPMTAPITGRAWHLPAGTNGPTGLLIDPADPQRLYLSAWGVYHAGRRHRRRHFSQHRCRHDVASRSSPSGQHVYDVTLDSAHRSALRERLRPGRLAIRRSRRDVDAHPRLQLQVGTSRDSRSREPGSHLHHDVRRQRVARTCGGRSRRVRRCGGANAEQVRGQEIIAPSLLARGGATAHGRGSAARHGNSPSLRPLVRVRQAAGLARSGWFRTRPCLRPRSAG